MEGQSLLGHKVLSSIIYTYNFTYYETMTEMEKLKAGLDYCYADEEMIARRVVQPLERTIVKRHGIHHEGDERPRLLRAPAPIGSP